MSVISPYKTRPIRFLELYRHKDWQVKVYSISMKTEYVQNKFTDLAKRCLSEWLQQITNYPLETYKIATLILHECKEGCFAIINWWIDENMLQQFVYLASREKPEVYKLYSDKGMVSCVWELEVLWFERNAWLHYVLANAPNPNYTLYLEQHLNKD